MDLAVYLALLLPLAAAAGAAPLDAAAELHALVELAQVPGSLIRS